MPVLAAEKLNVHNQNVYLHYILYIVAGVLAGYFFTNILTPPKFMGMLIGAILICTVLARPKLGFFILIAVMPFLDLLKRIDVIYLDLAAAEFNNPISLIPELAIAVLFFYLVLNVDNWNTKGSNQRILSGTFILLLLCLIEIFNTGTTLRQGLMGFRYFAFFLLMVPIGMIIFQNKQDVINYLKLTSLLGVIVAIYSIFQALSDFPSWDRRWFELAVLQYNPLPLNYLAGFEFSWEEVRKFSTFSSPPATASFFVISIILTMGLMFNARGLYKMLYITCIFIMGAGLFFTYTRGCWIALVAGIYIRIVLRNLKYSQKSIRVRNTLIVVLVFLILTVSGISFIKSVNKDFFSKYTSTSVASRVISLSSIFSNTSMTDRYYTWSKALKLASEHPFTGLGMGTSSIASGRAGKAFHVDNLYFKLLIETGLPGLILFLLLLWYIYSHSRGLIKNADSENTINLISTLTAVIVSMAFYGLVAPVVDLTIIAVYFWFITGLLANWARFNNA
jgi:O-antigen ligase